MIETKKYIIESVMGIKTPAFIFARAIVLKENERKQITIVSDEQYEDDTTFTFSKINEILKGMTQEELYNLKGHIYSSEIMLKMVDKELRRRHKALNKKQNTLKQDLKSSKKKITLQNGEILIRASQIKEK